MPNGLELSYAAKLLHLIFSQPAASAEGPGALPGPKTVRPASAARRDRSSRERRVAPFVQLDWIP